MMLVKIHPVLNPKICLNPQPLYSSQINETHFTDRYRDAVLAFATDEQKQLFRANQNRHLTITRPNSFQEKLMQQLIHIAKLFLDQDNSVKLSEPVKFDFAESLCRVSNDTTENFYYCTRMLLLQCKSPSDISSLLAHYRYQLVLKACASKIIYSSIKLYIDVANAMGLAIEFDEEKSLIDLKYISQSIIKSIEKVFTDEFTPEHLATNLLNNELRKRGYIGYQHAGYNESNCMELMEWLQIILELYQDPHRLNLVFKDRYNLFIMQQDKIVDLNWPNITSMFIGILIPSNVFENFVPLSPLLQYKGNGFHYRLELLGSQQNDGSILMRYEVESVSERRNTQRDYYNRFLYMPSPDNRRWQDRGVSPYSFPEELHAGLYSLVMQRLPSIVKSKESSLCILRFFNSDHAFHLLNNIQNNFFLYFKRIEKFIEVVKQLNEEHCYLLTYFLVKMDARILSPHPELVPWLEQLELPQRRSVLKALSPHCHGFFNLSLQAFVMYYETVSAEQRKEWLISKKQVLQNFCQSPAELKFVYQHIELHNDLFEILRDLLFLHINSLKLLSEFIPYFDKKHITDCHQHIIRRCGDDINNLDEFRTRMSLVPKDEVNNFLVSRIESLHMIVTDKFQLKRLIEMCPPHAEIEYCRLLKDLILKFLANAHDLYVVSWNMNSLSFCGIYQVIYEYAPMTVEQMLIEFPDFRKPSYNYSECQKIILRKISAIDDPLQILAFLPAKDIKFNVLVLSRQTERPYPIEAELRSSVRIS